MGSIRKAALVAGAVGALLMAGAGTASADSSAYGAAFNSPGFLSGNVIQIPIDAPSNFCGNSFNRNGLGNPAFGNTCINGGNESDGMSQQSHADRGDRHSWDHHNRDHDQQSDRG